MATADLEMRRAEQHLTQVNIHSLATLVRRAVWGKRMPNYEECFTYSASGSGTKKAMSDEAMYNTAKAINAALGGKED